MTPYLIAKQEGWDAAMRYIARWCRKAQETVNKDLTSIDNSAFEETAIMAENLVQTPPKEFK